MFRSLILAAALLAFTPLAANAGEITLLPSIKLQIGDRDDYGNYWDGGRWRDRDYWHNHYECKYRSGSHNYFIVSAPIAAMPFCKLGKLSI